MIQLNRNYNLPEKAEPDIPIKVVGVGGAGSNALDRIVLDGLEKADLIAINTDVQSLASSVAASKVQLGRTVTRGLGAGGDPAVGYNAAYESADEIRQALRDARMIFICAGLGGGTGSGAAPAVAQVAREHGSLVLGFATLPFAFEGKRRLAQAQEALAKLRENCDAVICFENDRLGDMVAPKAGIHQAFAAADQMISQSVRSITSLIQRPGLIRIGFDDLLAALRSPSGRCLFGFGESDSDNRAHDALTQALKNPLMDRGRMLADATHLLVQVAGGPGMTLSEVEVLMQELGRHVHEQTQILFGAVVDGRLGDRLTVTIITSLAPEEDLSSAQTPSALSSASTQPQAPEQYQYAAPQVNVEPEPVPMEPVPPEESISFEHSVAAEPLSAPPPVTSKPKPVIVTPLKKAVSQKEEKLPTDKSLPAKQEILQFEHVTRGRLEKSEPTIVDGEDLDVPTYLRKNIKVK